MEATTTNARGAMGRSTADSSSSNETKPAPAPTAASASEPRPRRILLAEDDEAMRSLIATVLRRQGYEVLEKASGSTALEGFAFLWDENSCEVEPVDMVISDIRMPGVSGMSIAAGLRELLPQLPIVLITAFGDAETHARAKDMGVTAIFDKPFDLDDLLAVVRRVLPLH